MLATKVAGLRNLSQPVLLNTLKNHKIESIFRSTQKVLLQTTFSRNYKLDTRVGKYLLFDEFKKAIDDNKTLIIDVRSKEEIANYGKVNASNHVNIPLPEFADALNMSNEDFEEAYKIRKPSTEQQFVIHCLGGIRSSHALRMAEGAGYVNAQHYAGGYAEWVKNTRKR